MIPALGQATIDARLDDLGVRILAYLITSGELDVVEFRQLKEFPLRRTFHRGRATVYRALKRLAETGYLERSEPVPGEARLYRLAYSVSPVKRTNAA